MYVFQSFFFLTWWSRRHSHSVPSASAVDTKMSHFRLLNKSRLRLRCFSAGGTGNKDNISLQQNLSCSLVSLSALVFRDSCISRLAMCICSALLSLLIPMFEGTLISCTKCSLHNFWHQSALSTSFPKVINFLITLRLFAVDSLKLVGVELHNAFRKRRLFQLTSRDSSEEVSLWSLFLLWRPPSRPSAGRTSSGHRCAMRCATDLCDAASRCNVDLQNEFERNADLYHFHAVLKPRT